LSHLFERFILLSAGHFGEIDRFLGHYGLDGLRIFGLYGGKKPFVSAGRRIFACPCRVACLRAGLRVTSDDYRGGDK
jgi:hypothetical protein